jgi:hypothetical protein
MPSQRTDPRKNPLPVVRMYGSHTSGDVDAPEVGRIQGDFRNVARRAEPTSRCIPHLVPSISDAGFFSGGCAAAGATAWCAYTVTADRAAGKHVGYSRSAPTHRSQFLSDERDHARRNPRLLHQATVTSCAVLATRRVVADLARRREEQAPREGGRAVLPPQRAVGSSKSAATLALIAMSGEFSAAGQPVLPSRG